MLGGAAEMWVRAEVKGFAARQFKEMVASFFPKLEFLVLFPFPSDLELMFLLGIMFDVPVPGLPCCVVEVG